MSPSFAERRHRLSRCFRLREVLRDGARHSSTELAQLVGHRFGSAVERVRKGMDGGQPWLIERRQLTEDGRIHDYRYLGVDRNPPLPGKGWKGRALAAERRAAELEAEVEALRRGLQRPTQGTLFAEDAA